MRFRALTDGSAAMHDVSGEDVAALERHLVGQLLDRRSLWRKTMMAAEERSVFLAPDRIVVWPDCVLPLSSYVPLGSPRLLYILLSLKIFSSDLSADWRSRVQKQLRHRSGLGSFLPCRPQPGSVHTQCT